MMLPCVDFEDTGRLQSPGCRHHPASKGALTKPFQTITPLGRTKAMQRLQRTTSKALFYGSCNWHKAVQMIHILVVVYDTPQESCILCFTDVYTPLQFSYLSAASHSFGCAYRVLLQPRREQCCMGSAPPASLSPPAYCACKCFYIHHIFIRYSSIHFVLSTFRQSFQSVCRNPGLPCLCLQWRRQRPQPHFTPQCCRAASEAKRHVAGMDMLKTSQQTGLCRCGNKAEMQSRR